MTDKNIPEEKHDAPRNATRVALEYVVHGIVALIGVPILVAVLLYLVMYIVHSTQNGISADSDVRAVTFAWPLLSPLAAGTYFIWRWRIRRGWVFIGLLVLAAGIFTLTGLLGLVAGLLTSKVLGLFG